mmetsp:Transcript_16183/g.32268  ORF Transcript_16183/g.32268 Transcript_16183/m.32268 type:complete len:239 (-) Transcript_16183:56-772(-)
MVSNPMHIPVIKQMTLPKNIFTSPLFTMSSLLLATPNVTASTGPMRGDMSIEATTVVPESPTRPDPDRVAAMPDMARKSKVSRDWDSMASFISSTLILSLTLYSFFFPLPPRLMLGIVVTRADTSMVPKRVPQPMEDRRERTGCSLLSSTLKMYNTTPSPPNAARPCTCEEEERTVSVDEELEVGTVTETERTMALSWVLVLEVGRKRRLMNWPREEAQKLREQAAKRLVATVYTSSE